MSFGFYALFGIVLFFWANNEFVDLSKSVGTDTVRLFVGQIGLGDSKNPASRHPSTVSPPCVGLFHHVDIDDFVKLG